MRDKTIIPTHMRRFRVMLYPRANQHISYLHIYCQLSIRQIALATGISVKTTTRILMGQLPTRRQLRLLQKSVLQATIELEKHLSYTRTSRAHQHHGEITHHLIGLGRLFSRTTKVGQ